jgi:anhydro-N-acetylmuramic acid kinase
VQALEKVTKKRRKLVIGLMSGTSADGIDAVLVELRGSGPGTAIRRRAFVARSFPRGYTAFVLENSGAQTARLDDVARLNMLSALLFADAARAVARRAGISLADVDLIGSHGQTIHHLPRPTRLFGKTVRATLQIGDPSVIAKLTGVVTVGNFRAGDVALGGSGAPLVPYFDYLVLRSGSESRATLNIGGISNITVLPRNCGVAEVTAFDTGPGNMVIDALMKTCFGKPFDRGGKVAAGGTVHPGLLRWMMRHPYFAERPPKSTGREMFGESFVKELLRRGRTLRRADLVATATAWTALAVFDQYRRFVRRRTPVATLLVSGGGSRNTTLMEALRKHFEGVRVASTSDSGVPAREKEAICFAVLANETIAGNPANIPGATGARRPTVLGVICPP